HRVYLIEIRDNIVLSPTVVCMYFVNARPSIELSPLSLHDALPILYSPGVRSTCASPSNLTSRSSTTDRAGMLMPSARVSVAKTRSEEHTSELQSRENLVCRLLLEKKKKKRFTLMTKSRILRFSHCK